MVRDRNDWCISRQRRWGVPIPIFYCKDCGEPLISKAAMQAVADLFRVEGSDAWYAKDAAEILPAGFKCEKCGCTTFTKERDIMDVWFDSGVTHAAVCDERDSLHWPADLYLEGADQYRGWFQSSLLTSIAWRGKAPYKAVATHGWVVDGQGRAMHKSLGNGILPKEIVDKYGADILRLWVASSDYHADIRISPEILKQLSDAYRKIRNTARYILGNLSDFDPDTNSVPVSDMLSIDKWALNRLDSLIFKVREGYEALEFHQAYHAIHNFCVVDMSNFYLDVIKDRLYTDKKDSTARRAAQTAMYIILDAMTRLIAPILALPPTKSGRACRTAATATRAMSFTTRCRSSSAHAPARRFLRNSSPAGIRSMRSATSSRRRSKTPAQKSRSALRSTRRSRSTAPASCTAS